MLDLTLTTYKTMPTTYAIPNGRTVMDATTYTGNGSSLSVTNAGSFKPDFVWYKGRSNTYNNGLFDSVRGTTKFLASNLSDAEATYSGVTSFDSSGFTVGSDAGGNSNGASMVAWQWQAGQGSTSTNNNGSVTSTVSVNATAGFSIVTYTNPASGSSWTVGHGLGVAPAMIITKQRSATSGWAVYHQSLGATNSVFLQSTGASASRTIFNNTAPTSTVMSFAGLGSNYDASATMVAYCWAPVAGFSQFGSYTGNGSADGPFVYTGFRPKFVLRKRTDTTSYWVTMDSTRNTYNLVDLALYPNDSLAESSDNGFDFLSNGFKIRSSGSNINASGGTYIYMAFAENPTKFANAR